MTSPRVPVMRMHHIFGLERLVFALSFGLSLGVLIAITLSVFFKGWHFELLSSGDFPGFYTAGKLAAERSPELYSEVAQSALQQKMFPDRSGYYFTVYPAMTAAFLIPLSWVSPEVGKLALCLLMLVAACAGIMVPQRRFPPAMGHFEVMLLFSAPFFVGIISGQNSSLSFLFAGLFLALLGKLKLAGEWRNGRDLIFLGVVAGLWCFKPQYGLLAIAFLVGARLLLPLVSSAFVLGCYYLVGVGILGWSWPFLWADAATRFALPNLEVNGHQMTSLLALFRWVVTKVGADAGLVAIVSQLMFPMALALAIIAGANWRRHSEPADRAAIAGLFVALIPLLAPQTLFYDLSIAFAATLAVGIRSRQRGWILFGAVLVSHWIFFQRESGGPPLFAFLAIFVAYEVWRFGRHQDH